MAKPRLFTIVLEYKGGTYIAQSLADSPDAALSKWISEIRDEEFAEWGIARNELAKLMKSENVIPINDCVNVWCISGSGKHGLVLVNLVATDRAVKT